MPIQSRPAELTTSETEAERFLEGGNDQMIESLIRGMRDIERAQRWITWEAQNQNRRWVMELLKDKIRELGET